jgi:hypothetical protein
MSLATSSPRRRASEWNATKAGDSCFDISLIVIEIEIGLCPGLRFTTTTLIHSELRSMLETADWDRSNVSLKLLMAVKLKTSYKTEALFH